jgi:hypothetical protein
LPAATPSVPPQLVACRGRDFYRITTKSLQAFEVSERIPPPQIRGSATAQQKAQVDVAEPLNVILLSNEGVLVIAKHNVFRYERGQEQTQLSAPVPTPSPLQAWPDPRSADSFWVRTLGDPSLHRYTLAVRARPDSGSPRKAAKLRSRVQELSEFDGHLFAVLADGVPFYSTKNGMARGAEAQPLPFPKLSRPATVVFPDSSPDRYWAADAWGNLGLWDRKRGESPVLAARVPGAVIDVAIQGARVAVLSMELSGPMYRPTVTIFSNGEQQGRLSIGPSAASPGQPELDLCLIAGRPWVVVGGRHWLQLLDWSSPRLLAEW